MHITRLTLCTLAAVLLTTGCTSPPNSLLRLQAREKIDTGDYTTAREKLERALAQDPADWKANYYMGLVKLAQDQPLVARLHLEVAYSLRDSDPETPDILDALAEALQKEGAAVKLDSMLKSAVATYGTPRDYYRQAKYLGQEGDVDGARAAFLKATKAARPDDVTPYVKLADFYESLGDRVNAVVALQQALTIEPQNRTIARRISALVLDPDASVEATLEPATPQQQ